MNRLIRMIMMIIMTMIMMIMMMVFVGGDDGPTSWSGENF